MIDPNTFSSEVANDKYTRHSPGCYHSALRYLSELTGIPEYREVEVFNYRYLFDNVRRFGKPNKLRLKYKSYDITVVDLEGNKHPYIDNTTRYDAKGIIPVKFIVRVRRTLEEYNVPIKAEGTYIDSLGGGWQQKVGMYSINGNFFADMNCAHS